MPVAKDPPVDQPSPSSPPLGALSPRLFQPGINRSEALEGSALQHACTGGSILDLTCIVLRLRVGSGPHNTGHGGINQFGREEEEKNCTTE
jgi:hypothetical protein